MYQTYLMVIVIQTGRQSELVEAFEKEEDGDHDQDFLLKDMLHIWSWSSEKCYKEVKNDDHDQDSLEKDLLCIWSWSSKNDS